MSTNNDNMVDTLAVANILKAMKLEKQISLRHSIIQSKLILEDKNLYIYLTDIKSSIIQMKVPCEGRDGIYSARTSDIINMFQTNPHNYSLRIEDNELIASIKDRKRIIKITQLSTDNMPKLLSDTNTIEIFLDMDNFKELLKEANRTSMSNTGIGFIIHNHILEIISISKSRASFYRGSISCEGLEQSFSILGIYTFLRMLDKAKSIRASDKSILIISDEYETISEHIKIELDELLLRVMSFNIGEKVATITPAKMDIFKSELRSAISMNQTPKSQPNIELEIKNKYMMIRLIDNEGGGSEGKNIPLIEDSKLVLKGVLKPEIISIIDNPKDIFLYKTDNRYLLNISTEYGSYVTTLASYT